MRVEPEPDPNDDPPFRYAFLISTSVVLIQFGIGLSKKKQLNTIISMLIDNIHLKTSQNARSCESKTFLSSLSRFLSTLLCAGREIENMSSNSRVTTVFIRETTFGLHKNKFPFATEHFL